MNISKKGVKNSFTINGIGTFTSTPDKKPRLLFTSSPPPSISSKPQVGKSIPSELTEDALWHAASHGDPKALENLINFKINTQGLECRVTHSAALLKILVRGTVAPDIEIAQAFKALLENIQPQGYNKVIITGRPISGKVAWSEEWDLNFTEASTNSSTSELTFNSEPSTITESEINSLSIESSKLAISTATPIFNKTRLKWFGLALGAGINLLLTLFVISAVTSIYQGRKALKVADELIQQSVMTQRDLNSLRQSDSYLEKARLELDSISPLPGAGKKLAQSKIAEIEERLFANQVRTTEEKARIAEEKRKIAIQQKAEQDLEKAKEIAKKTSESVQNPPHPMATWEKARSGWMEAILLLENIPLETSVYTEVQKRLTSYKNNLNAIEIRLTIERQSAKKYEEIRLAGDRLVALTKELEYPNRDNVSKLKQLQVELEKSIKILRTIPATTAQYEKAQNRLKAYSADYQKLVSVIKEIEVCIKDPLQYSSSCFVLSLIRVSTFSDSKVSYGDIPVRASRSGTCDCPYDTLPSGKRCGSRSAYSKPGGSSPICYK